MFKQLRGRVKRDAFLAALLADRRLSGRGQRARRYRPVGRRTLTRAEALALWSQNRRWNAASRRADRKHSAVKSV